MNHIFPNLSSNTLDLKIHLRDFVESLSTIRPQHQFACVEKILIDDKEDRPFVISSTSSAARLADVINLVGAENVSKAVVSTVAKEGVLEKFNEFSVDLYLVAGRIAVRAAWCDESSQRLDELMRYCITPLYNSSLLDYCYFKYPSEKLEPMACGDELIKQILAFNPSGHIYTDFIKASKKGWKL